MQAHIFRDPIACLVQAHNAHIATIWSHNEGVISYHQPRYLLQSGTMVEGHNELKVEATETEGGNEETAMSTRLPGKSGGEGEFSPGARP